MRLFVALWPPPPVIDVLAGLERPAVEGVRWTTPDQWHVTVRFLGEVAAAADVADLLDAVDLPRADVQLGPSTQMLGRDVLMVPAVGVDALADAVISATAALGRPPDHRPFHGHVTLARRKGRARLRTLAGRPVTARWPVHEVAVVASRLGRGGARYATVATVPVTR